MFDKKKAIQEYEVTAVRYRITRPDRDAVWRFISGTRNSCVIRRSFMSHH